MGTRASSVRSDGLTRAGGCSTLSGLGLQGSLEQPAYGIDSRGDRESDESKILVSDLWMGWPSVLWWSGACDGLNALGTNRERLYCRWARVLVQCGQMG